MGQLRLVNRPRLRYVGRDADPVVVRGTGWCYGCGYATVTTVGLIAWLDPILPVATVPRMGCLTVVMTLLLLRCDFDLIYVYVPRYRSRCGWRLLLIRTIYIVQPHAVYLYVVVVAIWLVTLPLRLIAATIVPICAVGLIYWLMQLLIYVRMTVAVTTRTFTTLPDVGASLCPGEFPYSPQFTLLLLGPVDLEVVTLPRFPVPRSHLRLRCC